MLLIESGMVEPPFSPEVYAPLRSVKQVLYRDMKIDGRLIPSNNDFIIELRKDRSTERINFTFAHELAHTFFYESVPSIKYRTLETNYSEYDEEEEKLCDIAASELLMPAPVFSKIVKDFSPSPQALKRISQLFKTSLQATLIKLQTLNLWNASFVLWKFKDGKPEAQWITRPQYGLSYEPKFKLLNLNETSIHHTFLTGDDTADYEWFSLNDVCKKSFFKSIQLNSTTVLSCFSNNLNNESILTNKDNSDLPPLTSKCICRCDGTGWYPIRQNGMKYAARCLALTHQNQRSSKS
jgi:Zn-dependent peptidase ImmA (M78 family)